MEELYHFDGHVASGTGGRVFKGLRLKDEEVVAIKIIDLKYPHKEKYKRLYREICILKHLDSSFTLSLLDVYGTKENNNKLNQIFLILPFMEYDLKSLIKNFNLTFDQIIKIIYQILMGLKYLSESGIIHRDLKPANIGIKENLSLKILDFGLARDKQDDLTEYVVTRWYRPLEVFCTSQYTMAVDMWSAGCIAAELFTKEVLFKGENQRDQSTCILKVMGWPSDEMLSKMNQDSVLGLQLFKSFAADSNKLLQYIQKPVEISVSEDKCADFYSAQNVIDLIFKMLELDPDNRISANEALNSLLFTRNASYILSYIEQGTVRDFNYINYPEVEESNFWEDKISKITKIL